MASSLPSQSTSFIGRSAELAAIARLLADPACRLLTLLGPGGIGKTRLALAVADAVQDDFPDGVCFVALAALADAGLVASAIARVVIMAAIVVFAWRETARQEKPSPIEPP